MPKPDLPEPLERLEREIIEALLHGHREWRPDLPFPESYSDMQGAVRGLLCRFDVTLKTERDEQRSRADKAEAERDAALAKLHDWRFARWRELPEAERKVAGDLLNQFGHLANDGPQKEKARLYWWALDCLEAVTDTLAPPKDPRIEAWRALDAETRSVAFSLIGSARLEAVMNGGIAAADLLLVAHKALEALAERP